MKNRALLFVGLTILVMVHSQAADVTFQSSAELTHLLELYTSEGCSSCPPAEKWLAQLRQSPRLWKDFVPLAFHVDYWDGLGWPDRFAAKAHTARQRTYAALWSGGTVYTPAFVLDGAEWRGRTVEEIPAASGKAGILSATVSNAKSVVVTFQPARRAQAWEAHIATLGLDLSTHVKAGENSGRELRHDFVVLSHEVNPMRGDGDSFRAEAKLTAPAGTKIALAVWVSEAGKLAPTQAVGGPLAN
jgi:hypothetical protein